MNNPKKWGDFQLIKLVIKAQRGNETAFVNLFSKFEDDIYRIAYVYVKNESWKY